MKPRLILAFPRSGTKLLSSIHAAAGYRVYGEFFNTYSAQILNDTATRLLPETQRRRRDLKKELGANEFNYMHTIEIKDRCNQYKKLRSLSDEPSIVTAWYATFELVPSSIELLETHEILCLKRENTFEQLISRLITVKNLNHDSEVPTEPVEIDSSVMEYYYYYLRKTQSLQEYCVKQRYGFWVDFDELIAGNSDIGFQYTVNTVDQHENLRDFVKNYDEAYDFFMKIKARYDNYNIIEERNNV